MILFPAIDIKNQKCVRLSQGDFNEMKVYHDNPLEVSMRFVEEGATFLHIIDLDGAQNGVQVNLEVISKIAQTVDVPIQVGGGIRSIEQATTLLNRGVSRVILGSMAIDNIEDLKKLVKLYPKKIIVSIDAKQRKVTTSGWQNQTEIDVITLIKELEKIGIETIVYTDIAKDGMLLGPNMEDYAYLSEHTSLNIIASGGVTTTQDLIELNKIGLYGAIVGKAIYENRLTVKEAISCLQNASFPV